MAFGARFNEFTYKMAQIPLNQDKNWINALGTEQTQCVHAGIEPEPQTGSILTPIFQSAVFVQESIETYLEKGHSYSGSANPTVSVLERKIALLEKAQWALCFNSGMSAIMATLSTFLKKEDHCIIAKGCYGTTLELTEMLEQFGVTFSFIDFRDPKAIEQAIQANTSLIFSEYPTNPTLYLTDLATVSAIAHKNGIYHVCDSTLASPIVIRPLMFGADIVIQSTTKYYDGHNMTIGGAIACQRIEDHQQLFKTRSKYGSMMSPMVAFLTLQSSKTMSLRLVAQSNNGLHIATFLEQHPKVAHVHYPGLTSCPQHPLANRQHSQNLHGGMIYARLKGGQEARKKFMRTIKKPWSFGANLGAVESLISCPVVMSSGNMTPQQCDAFDIDPAGIRISCGIEGTADLVGSLNETLAQI